MKNFLKGIDTGLNDLQLENDLEHFIPQFINFLKEGYQIAKQENLERLVCFVGYPWKEPDKIIINGETEYDVCDKDLAIVDPFDYLWSNLFSKFMGKPLVDYYGVRDLFDFEYTMEHSGGEFMKRLNQAIRQAFQDDKVLFYCLTSEYALILDYNNLKASYPNWDLDHLDVFR